MRQSDREKLAPDASLLPTQGASLVAWLAKHRDAGTSGGQIMTYALSVAREAAKLQGAAAFVVDPFDDETAAMWIERFKFKRSLTRTPNGQRRLWAPLHTK